MIARFMFFYKPGVTFVILVIACYYLQTQGAYLCKLCLYLLGYFLGFLLGVCNRSFLREVARGYLKKPLQVNCNTRFIKEHKPSSHIRARIKSHVYTTE